MVSDLGERNKSFATVPVEMVFWYCIRRSLLTNFTSGDANPFQGSDDLKGSESDLKS